MKQRGLRPGPPPGRRRTPLRMLGDRRGRELHDLFKACDVVAVPSRNEPFGIVILEGWRPTSRSSAPSAAGRPSSSGTASTACRWTTRRTRSPGAWARCWPTTTAAAGWAATAGRPSMRPSAGTTSPSRPKRFTPAWPEPQVAEHGQRTGVCHAPAWVAAINDARLRSWQ